MSIVDASSKDTAAPTICSEQSSSSSKTSKKKISFSIPQESVCEKIYSSSISSMADSVTEERSEVCCHKPGISGLTKMSETLIENIITSVVKSEQSNEEKGVCPFVQAPVSPNEDMASNLVQFILEEKKKYQFSDAVVSESSESLSDQRAEKLDSGTTEEFDTCFFPSKIDSDEKQICGEEKENTVCEYRKQHAKRTCSEPKLVENIDVVLLPHVMKSITEYVKYSIYLSQLDQLCGTKEADKFKNDVTRQELQDFFLELVTKEIIQNITECKKQALFIDKSQSQYLEEEDRQDKENEYTAPDDVSYDTVCPLTRKETVTSWAPRAPVCDTKLYDESFVSVDELNKALCMEGVNTLSRASDSSLQKPVVVYDQSTNTSQLNLFSDAVISNTYQGLESSFESSCVCPFEPLGIDVCKFPEKQSSPLILSDKESICTLSAIEPSDSIKINSYDAPCTFPIHFEDRKLSVSSTEEPLYSTGSSEADSLVQTALCNIWASIPSEKQLTSEAREHDKLHSSESSIALDDLSEELLTEALVSIFSQMIESLLPELSDKTSESSHSSQVNLLSEKIVSDVMQELKCSSESSSSLLLPSTSESSDKDISQRVAFHKGSLRKQTPAKPPASVKISSHGKTPTIAQRLAEKKLSSSSSSTEETPSSTISDADNLVQAVLSNILSSKLNKDPHSSKTVHYEKEIQQQAATPHGNEFSSGSSLSLDEFPEVLSKEDVVTICSRVADSLLQKSLPMPSHRTSHSQLSLLSERIVTNIIQVLKSSLESSSSSLHKASFDDTGTNKLNIRPATEPPIPIIMTSDDTITKVRQTSDSSSTEETSHSTSGEADDVFHETFRDTSIGNIIDTEEEAVPVKIVLHKRLMPLKVNPEIISEHLSVISIKTEPIELLQQRSLLQTGHNLQEIRSASMPITETNSKIDKNWHVSFHKSEGSLRRGSLDSKGRLDVKRKEVLARNSFINLFNPDISKVELLKDVEDKKELIVRLVAHDVPLDPEHADEDEDEDEEEETEGKENANQEEEIIHEDVGLFNISPNSTEVEEPVISDGSDAIRDTIVGNDMQPSSLKKNDKIGDKTINDYSVEKLRYNNAQYERRQSLQAFMELLHKSGQQEAGNELTVQQITDSYENITGSGIISRHKRVSSEGHIPHPPQERKPWSKEFSHVRFDPKALLSSVGISDMTMLKLKEMDAKHQSKK
ncbi:uncharacterized protein [Heterodontus francisci]|uniref:uncharacterized protein n=1 Tax=Heterodontus francisci TaxID=7792 RepID=UPI00355B90B5